MRIGRQLAVAAAGIVVMAVLAGAGFFIGGRTAGAVATRAATSTPRVEGFELFYDVWRLVQQDYVGDVPADADIARGAVRGMLSALGDSATAIIAPEFARLDREDSSGFYKGIGASVRPTEDGRVQIASLYSGSPAEEAGVKVGDIILAVGGESMEGRSLYEVVSLIRGPEGTSVEIRFSRPETGVELDLEVERREIEIRTAELRMLPSGIAHVRLNDFNARAATQLRAALQEANRQGAWAVVLDLRDNPGGFLDQAVAVADEFLDAGLVVTERGRLEASRAYNSRDGGLATDMPLVVLINGGSASASEIVAGAVQARERGVLVGEKSYGKGSVQLAFDLSDGSELRVTVARWYTPDDRLIQGEGLEPDIVVPAAEGDGDPQLDAAVLHLQEKRP